MRWLLKMAWRDSRGSRSRLFLFLLTMSIGVAALVAINSFSDSLRRTLAEEARGLLGADLILESPVPFSPTVSAWMDSLGGRTSDRVSFQSMAYFPKADAARLVTVRASEGGYPFYGRFQTAPPEASEFADLGYAVVDPVLVQTFGLAIGDSLQIGAARYAIGGVVERAPRDIDFTALVSPRVYLPLSRLDTTLVGFGSRVEFERAFAFDDARDVDAWVNENRPRLTDESLSARTVSRTQARWDTGFDRLYRFLNLVAFIALLLGGLGIASSIHTYVQSRQESIAVLRCIGAPTRTLFGVYLTQSLVLGACAGIIGTLAGTGLLVVLPWVLADFLPVAVPAFVSLRAVLLGMGVGVTATLLFALLPLVRIRAISPMQAFRVSDTPPPADRLQGALYGLLVLGIVLFAWLQAGSWAVALGYAAGVLAVFALLGLTARGLTAAAKRLLPAQAPYVVRQGVANLYRPRNQTLLLLMALGLGTFLLLTLVVVEATLVRQFSGAEQENTPNVLYYDVQAHQIDPLQRTLREQGLEVQQVVPVVTMRLVRAGALPVEEMRRDPERRRELSWAHTREYRSSYRESLTSAERLLEGTYQAVYDPSSGRLPEVSVEGDLALDLGVAIGDTLVWNVAGRQVATVIGSLREVDWRRLQTNFFVLFPVGVLEQAPQFGVVLARSPSPEASARAQAMVAQTFPAVSGVDLDQALTIFDALFSRIAFIVRFMAGFALLTGALVLISAVMLSRVQREGEVVLLKTLGASYTQVKSILRIEYLTIGLLGALVGVLLALVAGWALARFVFDAPAVFPALPLILGTVTVMVTTLWISQLAGRGIYQRPALEVLKAET